MKPGTDEQFIAHTNSSTGIIHKICRVYADAPEERQDLCQEILYQLWKAYPSYKGASKFSTWLYRVALNTALTYVKKSRKEPQKVPLPDGLLHADHPPPEEEKRNMLYAAINTLSGIDKAIIILYLEDNSYDEIAAITGITANNVSVRLVRIRKLLKEKMKHIL